MKHVPSYGKILTLGALYTENALQGEVVVQEKVDGSQFRFGVNDEGVLVVASKGATIDIENPPQLFRRGVEYLQTLDLTKIPNDTYFYGEYLEKPRHNTLAYDRIPKNHIVLFDVLENGQWISRSMVEVWANILEVDNIPELYRGEATTDTVLELLSTASYLGGQTLEGVVIKNYEQKILYAGREQTLFTKYVREEFKELHKSNPDWQSNTDKVTALFQDYRTETRWNKAVQHMRDAGILEQSPRDIGKLMGEVYEDIVSECEEEIKGRLWALFKKQFYGSVTKGMPEWYKQQLLDNVL